jgi:hypothetical protein
VSELRQRQPVVKRRRRQTRAERTAEQEAQERFEQEVLRMDFGRCIGLNVIGADHTCPGQLQAHHCIRQQTLRAHISTLELSEAEINDWLWNPCIGVTVCDFLHARHTSRFERIPFEHLPARVIDFATDRSVLHLLVREHPPFAHGDYPEVSG